MDHIGSLLPKVLKKRGLDGHAHASLVILRAQEWICEHIPAYENDLHPQTFKDGVLFISCTHSIASQECQQQSVDLLVFLQEICEGISIEQIRLVRSDEKV